MVGGQRPRVCVVDSDEIGAAYPRLEESDLEVMALIPHLSQVPAALAAEFDVAVIGCAEAALRDPSFRAQVSELVQTHASVAVTPDSSAAAALEAAKIGFRGFVAREVSPEAFARTVSAAARGELAFPRAALPLVSAWLGRPTQLGGDGARPRLTPRQRQVVELVAGGATDTEIARSLHISTSTAHKHIQNALRRTNTKTRSQLVASTR